MSISIDPMRVGDGLQHSQKTTQPAAGSGALGAALNTRTGSMSGGLPSTPADKAAADASAGEAAKLSTEQARKSLDEINKVLAGMSISVQFQIDPNYKDVIVKVVDQESGKVVRQIPTVEVVRIAKAMDNLKGLLFAQTA